MRARKEVVFALSPVLRERISWDINKHWLVAIGSNPPHIPAPPHATWEMGTHSSLLDHTHHRLVFIDFFDKTEKAFLARARATPRAHACGLRMWRRMWRRISIPRAHARALRHDICCKTCHEPRTLRPHLSRAHIPLYMPHDAHPRRYMCMCVRSLRPWSTQVANALEQVVYAPSDRPEAPRLYIVFKGTVKYQGKLLGPGSKFGDRDFLLTGRHVVYTRAICKTYVHADYLHAKDLWEIAADFPEAHRNLMRHVLYEAFRQYMMNLGRDVKAAKRRGACVRVPTAAKGLMRGPGRIAGLEPSSSKAPNAAPSSTDGAVTTSLERVGETPTEPPMSVPQHLPIQIEISSELLSGIADACMTLSKVHQLLSKATVTRRAAADPATDSAPAPSCSQAGGGGWFGSDRAWARASNTALSSDVSSNGAGGVRQSTFMKWGDFEA
jgi:hypothetical protein